MTLPDWLDPLPVAEEMRETDRWAIEDRGVPSLDLMERAGAALADLATELAPTGPVIIVCGGGNNGGDGFVAARLLREAGREVRVAVTTELEKFKGDAKANLDRLPGEPPAAFEPAVLDGAAVAVDAILGTGFSGEVREPARTAIVALSESGVPVVACDVPSGVDASTGAVEDVAVRAAATATFHQAKPGLWIAPGKEHAGRVEVLDIGIPPDAPGEATVGLVRPDVLAEVPRRGAHSTKFSSGVVLVIGGARGLAGAPAMAALSAMRAGAGYVQVGAPATLEPSLALKLLEAMVVGLPEDDGALGTDSVDAVLAAVGRADAVVLGPGLGRSEGTQAAARALAARIDVPLVIDADGLNALVGGLEVLHERSWATVLTPHAGELARLLEVDSAEIERARLHHARVAAERARAVVVLKGDDTLVAAPGGRVAVSPGGAPALATAGTGDVLSGVTGAMLAKGLPAGQAACAAVHVHVLAGRLAAAPHGPDGVIASDVIAALPAALSR
jgi:ADP-dependent NAD(P)H-hydrate dehydratase / NAD(P)H-hydrate epimerase